MATSSPGRFWSTSAGRWIGSLKNIVGSLAAGAALVLQAVIGLGAWWPAVIVAAYAIGALVAPRDRVELGVAIGGGMTAEDAGRQLAELKRQLRPMVGRLPEDAAALVGKILENLGEIVGKWDALAGSPDNAHTVQAMIGDYLPTSVQGFVNLPRTFALSSRVEGKKTAHDELVDQLTILSTESDRIRTAVYSENLEALRDQGRFLRDKFSKSELDLGG
ncbi:MAG: hypothetical protein ABJB03_10495 [Rhodoglobus sp.]